MADDEPVTWTVSADRREADRDALVEALRALADAVRDLEVDIVPADTYWEAPDSGAFRDFTPLARLTHPHPDGLEYVAEELLDQFGWVVDFRPPEDE